MAKVNEKIKKTSNVKQKSLRMSVRLQERVVQQSLADNLPAVSQLAQSEPLDVGTTSTDYTLSTFGIHKYKMFIVFVFLKIILLN